ncbi:MAG: glycosyltransferase family 4 protein [Magnetococcales bacterium]|nr:glycosyltransferase family 4 protein [Magnetococcales bacterium]
MNSSAREPQHPPRTKPRLGFLLYDLKPFTADYLARIAVRLPGQLRAYPILASPVATDLPYSHRASHIQGRFFSVRGRKATPEGFLSTINWRAAWACAWENEVVVLSGIQGGSALATTLFATLLRRAIISVNQTLPPLWEGRRRWWIRLLKGWILHRCRVHVVQTPTTRQTLAEIYHIPDHRMVDAPFEAGATAFQNDLSRISLPRPALRQALAWPPESCIFLFVGTLLRFKGIFTLIDAAAILHQRGHHFQLLCIGEKAAQAGEWSLQAYQQRAADQGVGQIISFPGPRPLAELAACYLAADALVLPTQKDCFPKVLVEAAIAGLPLVTTDACGAANALVFDGETGFVIPPDDALALATAMEKLLDPELRQQLGSQARQRCLAFCDPERETDGVLQAIQMAL